LAQRLRRIGAGRFVVFVDSKSAGSATKDVAVRSSARENFMSNTKVRHSRLSLKQLAPVPSLVVNSAADDEATLVQAITPDMWDEVAAKQSARSWQYSAGLGRAALWVVIPVGLTLGWWLGAGAITVLAPLRSAPAELRQPLVRAPQPRATLPKQEPAADHDSIPVVALEALPVEAAEPKTTPARQRSIRSKRGSLSDGRCAEVAAHNVSCDDRAPATPARPR
jgi:hypothetical protein